MTEQKLNNLLQKFPDFAVKFINTSEVKPSSRLTYCYNVNLFLTYIGSLANKEINEISIDDIYNYFTIGEYIEHLSKDRINTKNIKLSTVSNLLEFISSEYGVSFDISFPTKTKQTNSAKYTQSEYIDLYTAAEHISKTIYEHTSYNNSLRDAIIFDFIYRLGFKYVEITEITLDDIDLEKKIVILKRKNNTITFRLSNALYLRLSSYVNERLNNKKAKANNLFVNQSGDKLGIRSIEIIIKNISSSYNCNFNPNLLRLLCGARIYHQTGSIDFTCNYLGISPDTMLDHYSCITPKNYKSTIVLDEYEPTVL